MNCRSCRDKIARVPYTTLITPGDLAPLLGDPGVAIVDCRFDLSRSDAGRQAYLTAHIPGACFADLNQDLSVPPRADTGRHPLPGKAQFATLLGALGIDNDTQVIAYDQGNGALAARFWWMLRWVGHDAVAVLDGGFDAWRAAGGAVEAGVHAAPLRHFALRGAD